MAYRVKYKYTYYDEITFSTPTPELALKNTKKAFYEGYIGAGTYGERRDPSTKFEFISITDKDTGEKLPITEQWIEEDDDFLTRREKG